LIVLSVERDSRMASAAALLQALVVAVVVL